jgi:hypothetical protein
MFLIVCSQSTKRLALALRSDGDCVTDLNSFVGDDDAVDEQFQQLPLAAEVCLLQTLPHALAERLSMSRKASGFGLTISVVCELAFLAIERQQSSLGIPSAALVLAHRHDAGKVGFREPLNLLVQPRPGAAQVGSSRLHFLRQPVPAASPLHRVHDHLRRGEHLAQVAPDQLLQRLARDVPRRAMFARRPSRGLHLGSADIVVVAPPYVPP